ncbi:hypothetical protein ABE237_19330 [Brevibacillus formosus]|uniref:hypothetical protein n=1 Tax=Brevibacillus TaxID=55080 RepID=UPI000D114252|nr:MULTISPECIES: hypothetical protein [Brevibacillus]MBG9945491.1 hypothetical protein [Brevibacillus formosus]MED1943869.1 hypothetical protein [Brevibacillus formosus]MED1999759.1 hypothetical protein [Brevibacillus formosus]MED2082104.1 hypothetical protein [Brevibacillus formosus]PSK18962.1 hypothetical protein C7R94_09280 [Brevibacillus sp. NRRL NRS-603]
MKIIACPTCEQDVQWDMKRLQKLEDRWVMACKKCGAPFFSVSKEEKEMILEGIRLTEAYVPDIIHAYHSEDVKNLPSRVGFEKHGKK